MNAETSTEVRATSACPVSARLVRLDARPPDKEAAIREVAGILAASGHVAEGYAESMLRREQTANTYLGHGVAIPHCAGADRHLVRRDGIAVLQVREGVAWSPGETVHLVIGIAAASDTHIAILRQLTRLLNDEAALRRLWRSDDVAAMVAALGAAPHEDSTGSAPVADLAERFEWIVDYPTGLHARPATSWVETARRAGCRMLVRHGNRSADATALVGLLQLGLRAGDRIVVSAEGPGAGPALARMRATITVLSAAERAEATQAAARVVAPASGWTPSGAARTIAGLGASPGLAIGRLYLLHPAAEVVPDTPTSLAEAADRLEAALAATRQQLKLLEDDTGRRLGRADAAIFRAQAGLLDDPDLLTAVGMELAAGHGLAWAWQAAVERIAADLAAVGNPVLAARAADLRDAGRRVLWEIEPSLRGVGSLADLPDEPVILIAEDLAPSDTASLDPARVVGIATAGGGPTSHTAILARTSGVPAMVGGGAELLALKPGTPAILDGDSGRLHLEPQEKDMASVVSVITEQRARRAREAAARAEPAVTRDGRRIHIAANVNLPEQVAWAVGQGAEGVGLMRTEFLFLERDESPDQAAQVAVYRAMADALEGRPLIVRALDIGGDKQVPHLGLPVEANPFLGVRGARLLLRRPDLMEPQLRALYRVAAEGRPLSIMFPMVTSLAEVLALREACERIRTALAAPSVPLGIMVEVPAAALQADALARHVDFFSIGTNDLTQYALAIDRQNPELAREADGLHPAVLRLVAGTAEAGARNGRPVGVCGGLAGERFGAAILTGLGVTELSMTPRDIPPVKAMLRTVNMAGLRGLAERALGCATAEEVRALGTELDRLVAEAAGEAA